VPFWARSRYPCVARVERRTHRQRLVSAPAPGAAEASAGLSPQRGLTRPRSVSSRSRPRPFRRLLARLSRNCLCDEAGSSWPSRPERTALYSHRQFRKGVQEPAKGSGPLLRLETGSRLVNPRCGRQSCRSFRCTRPPAPTRRRCRCVRLSTARHARKARSAPQNGTPALACPARRQPARRSARPSERAARANYRGNCLCGSGESHQGVRYSGQQKPMLYKPVQPLPL